MSLIPSANSGAPVGDFYYIENIGGSGNGADPVPCIKAGAALGLVRVGNPTTGLIAGATAGGTARVRGGGATSAGGSTLALGASDASFQNIVLTDGVTTINGTLSVPAGGDIFVGDDVTLGGDLSFTNGQAAGASISGQYVNTSPFAGGGAVANPAGLTPGLYNVSVIGTGVGEELAQASAMCFRTVGNQWFGNGVSFNFTAGVPNVAIGPVAGGATLTIGGAGIPAAGNVVFRKILNA
jgi:hypothetical protein